MAMSRKKSIPSLATTSGSLPSRFKRRIVMRLDQ
jgi:hypothetical protein